MASNRMKLDEFLTSHAEGKFLATVEAIASTDKVRVTPWGPLSGCLCDAALELPRSMIDAVSLTGRQDTCCGRTRPVVEVDFADSARHLRGVFSQLLERTQSRGSHVGPSPFMVSRGCQPCVAICARHPGSAACMTCWENCNSFDLDPGWPAPGQPFPYPPGDRS